MKASNYFKMILISAVLLSGCYVRYPSIGKTGHTVRPTNWRGERCTLMINVDTGKKVYVCGPDRYRR